MVKMIIFKHASRTKYTESFWVLKASTVHLSLYCVLLGLDCTSKESSSCTLLGSRNRQDSSSTYPSMFRNQQDATECKLWLLEINKLQLWKTRTLSPQTVRWLNKRRQKSHAFVIFAFFWSFVFFVFSFFAIRGGLRSHFKNSCFVFYRGFQTLENNESPRPNGLGLSSVFSCLETSLKHSHSFLKYYVYYLPMSVRFWRVC